RFRSGRRQAPLIARTCAAKGAGTPRRARPAEGARRRVLMASFAADRQRMVQVQIAARGVRDPGVLKAMGEVPRERFVPEEYLRYAYDDCPLPIGAGQTISQPFIVAVMIEAAEV